MLPSAPTLRAQTGARPRERISGARRVILLVGSAVIVFVLGAAVASVVALGSVDYALLNVAGACCLAVLLWVPFLKPDYQPIEPLSFVMLAVLVGITLKPAYIAFGPEYMEGYLLLNRQEPAFLLNGAFLALVGLSMLSVGYLLVLPRPGLSRLRVFATPVWSRDRLVLVGFVSMAIALAAMYLYIGKLGLSGVIEDFSRKRFYEVEGAEFERSALGYYRTAASVVGPVFLFVLAWALGRKAKIGKVEMVFIGVLVFMSVVFPFFNSSRTKVLMILLEALVIWKCVRGRIPTWMVSAIGIGMLALLLLLTALRPKAAEVSSFGDFLGVNALLETTVGSRHFLDLTKTSHIIEGVPDQLTYQYGMTYVAWVFMPVPRTVWLDKPALGAGPIIGQQIFGMQRAGVPPGMIAEAFLNFGYLGVLFCPFLIGVGLRWCYELFRPVLHTASGASLYAVTLIPVSWTTITGGFSQMMVALGVAVVPLLAIIFFVRVRQGPRSHAV